MAKMKLIICKAYNTTIARGAAVKGVIDKVGFRDLADKVLPV